MKIKALLGRKFSRSKSKRGSKSTTNNVIQQTEKKDVIESRNEDVLPDTSVSDVNEDTNVANEEVRETTREDMFANCTKDVLQEVSEHMLSFHYDKYTEDVLLETSEYLENETVGNANDNTNEAIIDVIETMDTMCGYVASKNSSEGVLLETSEHVENETFDNANDNTNKAITDIRETFDTNENITMSNTAAPKNSSEGVLLETSERVENETFDNVKNDSTDEAITGIRETFDMNENITMSNTAAPKNLPMADELTNSTEDVLLETSEHMQYFDIDKQVIITKAHDIHSSPNTRDDIDNENVKITSMDDSKLLEDKQSHSKNNAVKMSVDTAYEVPSEISTNQMEKMQRDDVPSLCNTYKMVMTESIMKIQPSPSHIDDPTFAVELCRSSIFDQMKEENKLLSQDLKNPKTPNKKWTSKSKYFSGKKALRKPKYRLIDSAIGAPLEVDYDINPTPLFLHIESNEWDECVSRIESHPDEAATWVYRLDKLHERQMWMMLPLHASIIAQAPHRVVQRLLAAYPDGAKERDSRSQLPIHIAANSCDPNDEVLNVLMSVYPKGCQKKSQGMTVSDYKENCPPLFSLIEKEDWKNARRRAKYYPEDAKKWVIKKESDGSTKRNLPLHAAIAHNAPKRIIETLLQAFPQSVKCLDSDGMIPLRLAIEKSDIFADGTPDDFTVDSAINNEEDETTLDVLIRATTYPEGIITFKNEDNDNDDNGTVKSGISQSDADVLANYDDSDECPKLYKLIRNREWSHVINRITTNPEEAHVWVEKSDEHGMLWRHLPIHASLILKPPHSVIEALLTVHVDSVRCCDSQNLLPLQIALNNGYVTDGDVVTVLVDAMEDPDSVNMLDPTDDEGRAVLLTNYDTNPTELYKLVEEKEWEECIEYIKNSDGVEEARTWIMKKNKKNGRLLWRTLPIHAAIKLGCPVEVVNALLEAYPDAITCVNNDGMTPYEVAVDTNARVGIIGALADANVDAMGFSEEEEEV